MCAVISGESPRCPLTLLGGDRLCVAKPHRDRVTIGGGGGQDLMGYARVRPEDDEPIVEGRDVSDPAVVLT